MRAMKGIRSVKVINLNLRSYLPTLSLQKWFEHQHLTLDNADQVIILVEHKPVYTAGFREKISLEEKRRLVNSGAEFVQSDRGGLTTFHGPGQLVAYPIFHLEKFSPHLTLRHYVSLLENTAVHTCRMLGIPAKLSTDGVSHTGAWVNNKKICAVGVHCRRHVTTHGIALNNSVDLKWYENIIPCGIQDKGVTSISAELGQEIAIETVRSQFLQSFQVLFNCSLEVYDHQFLGNILAKLDKRGNTTNLDEQG